MSDIGTSGRFYSAFYAHRSAMNASDFIVVNGEGTTMIKPGVRALLFDHRSEKVFQ